MFDNCFPLQQKGIEIWARPVLPVLKGKYSYAIAFLNRRTDGTPSEVGELHRWTLFGRCYTCILILLISSFGEFKR